MQDQGIIHNIIVPLTAMASFYSTAESLMDIRVAIHVRKCTISVESQTLHLFVEVMSGIVFPAQLGKCERWQEQKCKQQCFHSSAKIKGFVLVPVKALSYV